MCHTAHELTLHIPTHAKAFCLVDEALKLRRLLLSPRPLLHSFWLAPFSPFFSSFNWRFREQTFSHCRQCTRRSRGRHSPRFVYFSTCRVLIATLNQNKPLLLHIILLQNALFGHEACAFTGWRGEGGGVLNKCLYGDPRSNPLPFKNGVHRSINVNAGWFFLLFDDVPYYRDFL